jgi:hypothetical protein
MLDFTKNVVKIDKVDVVVAAAAVVLVLVAAVLFTMEENQLLTE